MAPGATFLALATLVLTASAAVPPPSVYWTSSPTLANETLVVAGSFASRATMAKLCTTRDCATGSEIPIPPVTSPWTYSVKVILPSGCGPPCFLHIAGPEGGPAVVAINAPDVWWALSGAPARGVAATTSRPQLSDQPLSATVTAGDPIRMFGRSLGWDGSGTSCLSAGPDALRPATTTQLFMASDEDGPTGQPVASATAASCYEATFATSSVAPGVYPTAVVKTPWGSSQAINLTVLQAQFRPPLTVHVLTVQPPSGLPAAVSQAVAWSTKHPEGVVNISMAPGTYTLTETLTLPNRTSLLGAGAGETILEFHLKPPPPPPAPPPTCSTPYVLADFYTKDCANRGCHTKKCPGCFLYLSSDHSTFSADGCCAACGQNPRCNAWTFVGDVDLPGGYCGMSYCPDEPSPAHPNSTCATTPYPPGPNNRTSGWILNRTKVPGNGPAAAIVVNGERNSLVDFSLRMVTAMAETPAVWAQRNATSFVATGLNITLLQPNVSNAFKIEAVGFEVFGNTMNQVASCKWPNYGPKSDGTPFQSSVTIYMHDARAGRLAGNKVYWRCSAFDLDGEPQSSSEPAIVVPDEEPIPLTQIFAALSSQLTAQEFNLSVHL
jgi:hypothetical protein